VPLSTARLDQPATLATDCYAAPGLELVALPTLCYPSLLRRQRADRAVNI